MHSPHPDKATLRRALRTRRGALSDGAREHAAHAVLRHALASGLLLRHARIGFYFPKPPELNVLPLLNQALWMRRDCYLPIVPARHTRRLRFSRLTDGHHWRHNRFGIAEFGHAKPAVRAWQLDLLFVPLLGFDARGYRVGMGGGYYDATLAHLRVRRVWRKPYRVGVAFACQEIPAAPVDAWDVPLDAVLTENGLRRFNAQKKCA
jgi:5-formyltetrahydrofolate cyclo-ligase